MEKRLIPYKNGWLCDLAIVYCMCKSFFFNLFFGWRSCNEQGCIFILSKRAWSELEIFIEEHYTEERKQWYTL